MSTSIHAHHRAYGALGAFRNNDVEKAGALGRDIELDLLRFYDEDDLFGLHLVALVGDPFDDGGIASDGPQPWYRDINSHSHPPTSLLVLLCCHRTLSGPGPKGTGLRPQEGAVLASGRLAAGSDRV